jgi:hypothetical protein
LWGNLHSFFTGIGRALSQAYDGWKKEPDERQALEKTPFNGAVNESGLG